MGYAFSVESYTSRPAVLQYSISLQYDVSICKLHDLQSGDSSIQNGCTDALLPVRDNISCFQRPGPGETVETYIDCLKSIC